MVMKYLSQQFVCPAPLGDVVRHAGNNNARESAHPSKIVENAFESGIEMMSPNYSK